MQSLNLGIITLFPEMFSALNYGIVGRAIDNKQLTIQTWNPRDFSKDKHRRVDDRPFGGGPGMVMMAEPLVDCIHAAKQSMEQAKVIYLSPHGRRLTQADFSAHTSTPLILIAGRYEGIDQRVIEHHVDEQWSIGDYVLSGGEFAAMVVIDGITRLIPEVLGHEESANQDSFMHGLLDYPHYTRPETFAGHEVPKVLLSGDHAAIARWRAQQALKLTWLHRPDLLDTRKLSSEETKLLEQFKDYRGESYD